MKITGTTSSQKPVLVEGTKYDQDKTPYDLLSVEFMEGIAEVLKFGAKKYEPHNWAKGIRYSRVFSALMRHLWDWWRGERLDPETNLHHLFHAGCCLMFLAHYESRRRRYRIFDDRSKLMR